MYLPDLRETQFHKEPKTIPPTVLYISLQPRGKNGGINWGKFTFKSAWELQKNKYFEGRSWLDYYLYTKLLIKAVYGQHNYLIPNRVQVLIYDFTFVQSLPVQLKFHIRITRAFKGKREHDRISNTHTKSNNSTKSRFFPQSPGLQQAREHTEICVSLWRDVKPQRCPGEGEMRQLKGKWLIPFCFLWLNMNGLLELFMWFHCGYVTPQ